MDLGNSLLCYAKSTNKERHRGARYSWFGNSLNFRLYTRRKLFEFLHYKYMHKEDFVINNRKFHVFGSLYSVYMYTVRHDGL